jgi:hypothetical protein
MTIQYTICIPFVSHSCSLPRPLHPIERNQLSSTIPGEIGVLSLCGTITLCTQTEGWSFLRSFPFFTNLFFFLNNDTAQNQLTGTIPSQIQILTSATFLMFGMYLLLEPPSDSCPVTWTTTNCFYFHSLLTCTGANQLIGTLPPEIGQLVSLSVLDFEKNQLTGAIPPLPPNLLLCFGCKYSKRLILLPPTNSCS